MDSEKQYPSQAQLSTSTNFAKEKAAADTQRKKTFFETPLGNVAGWLILAMLMYFSWYLFTHGPNPKKSILVPFLIYGNGLAYLCRWWDARKGRNT